jgi:hypothetical protein
MEDAILPLQTSFAREFAQDWVDAWNSHDLERRPSGNLTAYNSCRSALFSQQSSSSAI